MVTVMKVEISKGGNWTFFPKIQEAIKTTISNPVAGTSYEGLPIKTNCRLIGVSVRHQSGGNKHLKINVICGTKIHSSENKDCVDSTNYYLSVLKCPPASSSIAGTKFTIDTTAPISSFVLENEKVTVQVIAADAGTVDLEIMVFYALWGA